MRSNAGQSARARARCRHRRQARPAARPTSGSRLFMSIAQGRFGQPALGAELGSVGRADDSHVVAAVWRDHGLSPLEACDPRRTEGPTGDRELQPSDTHTLECRSRAFARVGNDNARSSRAADLRKNRLENALERSARRRRALFVNGRWASSSGDGRWGSVHVGAAGEFELQKPRRLRRACHRRA